MIRKGILRPDPTQAETVDRLQSLWQKLEDYTPGPRGLGWPGRLGIIRQADRPVPKGLYLFGPVGRGKSMLMDLLYDSVEGSNKRRVHFHEFMLEVHATMHGWRQRDGTLKNPLPKIAAEIAKKTWVLCFDEFQVDNIADAMILGRLFTALFDEGIIIIATSNNHPDKLYLDGLQRERFLPFIEILKDSIDILQLEARRDYRRDRLVNMGVYYTPLSPDSAAAMDRAFVLLNDGAEGEPVKIPVMGRAVSVPSAAKGVARFSFADLCEKPLGAPDFIAIAKAYHTVVLSDVPLLPSAKRNEAKRMVTLIDTLYDHRVNMIISAITEPDELCIEGDTASVFKRTASRLIEMRSEEYINAPHRR